MQTHIDVDFRPKLAVTPDDAIRLLVGGRGLDRRSVLKGALAATAWNAPGWFAPLHARWVGPLRRPRPGQSGWPTATEWSGLNKAVGNRLIRPISPFQQCVGETCTTLFKDIANPYLIRDNPALTQTVGWADAWTSQPSAYAVAAQNAADVAAAVRFAKKHNLRMVVKGGGHSYQGTSNAPDSLLIWTRNLTEIAMHDDFRRAGCTRSEGPAVSLGAGVIWQEAYNRGHHQRRPLRSG